MWGLVACAHSAESVEQKQKQKVVQNPNGEEVRIPTNPQRVADLSGSTEELLILGIEPVASGNVDFGNQTEFSPTIRDRLSAETVNVGWYAQPINLEAVLIAEPDLIIVGTYHEDLYEQLSQIAPTVIQPYVYYEPAQRLEFLANLFDKNKEHDEWVAQYERKVTDWKEKLKPVIGDETFVIVETYPKSFVVYSSSGMAELIYEDLDLERTEGIPSPETWGGIEINLESLSFLNPDHIILMENSENKIDESTVWSTLTAVQKGNVYKITSVENYNYSFTAMGRMMLLDRISTLILESGKEG